MDKLELKKRTIAEVIEREGGSKYTNRPADLGGPTRWGCTQNTAREVVGYTGDMREFPYELAFKVYEAFWTACKCDDIASRSERLCVYVYDYAVNSGNYRSSNCLQYLLNVLNYKEKWYKDISEDGIVGSRTIGALDKYIAKRGETGMDLFEEVFNSERMSFVVGLARKRETQEENIYGWLTRCRAINQQVFSDEL